MKNKKENSFFAKKDTTPAKTPAKAPAKAPEKVPAKPKAKKELTQQQKNLERARKLDR
tara:strand:+ start:557 stop:730 length:174 start_codon:yes stop_codon:yes gene_type:complete